MLTFLSHFLFKYMTKALWERTVLLDVTFVKFLFGIKCIISFVCGLYLVIFDVQPQN